ncbi:hypothetical protein K431DRAFT_306155 [Polychaeton citri CBS 116435]|uniref:R3H domain protein n=1 Tax=Polychaeton citri CBS 116435 TaxID=1314669 RepID=A0A9P4UMH2_9PEZI|nr:hypothetical protein K431DRAFT_306155 [Polychaeton citri CBS 116435]
MNNHNFDMYYDNHINRSPNSQRQQGTLNRQSSRQQFEPQHYLPSGLYTAEDHARFEQPRFSGSATVSSYPHGYDMGGSSWNPNAFTQNNTLNGLGGSGPRRPQSKGRTQLPSSWIDQSQPMPPLNPYADMDPRMGSRANTYGSDPDDELILTAIVIKNIPFAVKKEQLVQLMTELGLPLPYAFNYHFDNGVFRGLAFANFTNPEETAAVIEAMNHRELNGRKLRVEYKKMLPAAERERIEREKRERRGQLEEQHRPLPPGVLQSQPSMSSISSARMPNTSPSPASARNMRPGGFAADPAGLLGPEVDLNDPQQLNFYSKLLLFKEDQARLEMKFSPSLSPQERRIVHTLAHHMGFAHNSIGQADQRAVHVYKDNARPRLSPPMPQIQALRGDERRGLNRAATTDFSDVRGGDNFYGGGIRHQASGFLGYQDSLTAGSNLRAAKSFADLRSYTPSPVPSTASFPATLSNNVARLQEYGRDGTQANTPTLMTPTSGLADRGESQLINGLGNMNIGGGFNSPHGLRGYPSWDREGPAPGPIGGHRSFSTNFDERSSNRAGQQGIQERQARGPFADRGAAFPRGQRNGHAPRNSDELSQQSSAPEITVEQ